MPFWMKQLGGAACYRGAELKLTDLNKNGMAYKSKSGGNWDRWPKSLSHLKIRQKPQLPAMCIRAA